MKEGETITSKREAVLQTVAPENYKPCSVGRLGQKPQPEKRRDGWEKGGRVISHEDDSG